MRVVGETNYGKLHKDYTVQEAVANKLYPNAYGYQGQLEKLQQHIDLQAEAIAKLISALCNNGAIKTDQLQEILGYGFNVRLD